MSGQLATNVEKPHLITIAVNTRAVQVGAEGEHPGWRSRRRPSPRAWHRGRFVLSLHLPNGEARIIGDSDVVKVHKAASSPRSPATTTPELAMTPELLSAIEEVKPRPDLTVEFEEDGDGVVVLLNPVNPWWSVGPGHHMGGVPVELPVPRTPSVPHFVRATWPGADGGPLGRGR